MVEVRVVQGIAADADVSGLEHERRMDALRFHPRVEVRERVVGFLDVVGDVHQIGVGDVAAQVLPERLAQFVVVLGEQRLDRLELCLAPCRRTGNAGQEIVALTRDERGIVGIAHGHQFVSCVVRPAR